jgi:hypothetical protein
MHVSLTKALVGGQWSGERGENARADGMGTMEEKSCSYRDSNSDASAV